MIDYKLCISQLELTMKSSSFGQFTLFFFSRPGTECNTLCNVKTISHADLCTDHSSCPSFWAPAKRYKSASDVVGFALFSEGALQSKPVVWVKYLDDLAIPVHVAQIAFHQHCNTMVAIDYFVVITIRRGRQFSHQQGIMGVVAALVESSGDNQFAIFGDPAPTACWLVC